MPRERIIGQQRVIGLLIFLLTPFLLLTLVYLSSNGLVPFLAAAGAGASLSFTSRLRSIGVGVLTGTAATLGALMALAAMYAGVD